MERSEVSALEILRHAVGRGEGDRFPESRLDAVADGKMAVGPKVAVVIPAYSPPVYAVENLIKATGQIGRLQRSLPDPVRGSKEVDATGE